ncbi:MAG: DnaA regulatory inactivator Hda [Holosporales bacterium]
MKQSFLFEENTIVNKEARFIVTPSNQDAYNWLEKWPKSCDGFSTFLLGPLKSGKKTLSHIWARENTASYIDMRTVDLENQSISKIQTSCVLLLSDHMGLEHQHFLFHVFNHLKSLKKNILFISHRSIQEFDFEVNDLKSRLLTSNIITILQPDELLQKALYLKYFHSFGLKVSADVIDYLMIHFDRTYDSIFNLTQKLNIASLNKQRGITIPFIKEVIVQEN